MTCKKSWIGMEEDTGDLLTLVWVSKSYPLLKFVHMFRRGIRLSLGRGLGIKWLSFYGMG